MTDSWQRFHPALAILTGPAEPGTSPSLDDLARATHLSRFHFHRSFTRALGETGKQFADRVRLSRAAAALLTGDDAVIDVAVRHGFAAHETFTRAFGRHFGMSPSAYRRRGLLGVPPGASAEPHRHAQVVADVAPCVRLYGARPAGSDPHLEPPEDPAMTTEITTLDVPDEHALLVRRRISPDEVARNLGDILPAVFTYAQRIGAALSGPPVVRYAELSPGSMTIEAGFPLAAPCPGEGDIQPGRLGGTTVATTVHVGAYERLGETYRVLETWMDEHGLRPAGAPWEQYVTDPGEEPDVEKWRTVIFWPVAAADGAK